MLVSKNQERPPLFALASISDKTFLTLLSMYIIVPTFKYIIVGQEAFNSLLLCVRKMLLRLLVDSDNYLRMKKFTSLKGNLAKLIV